MNQAVLWNMDTLQTETTKEEHQYVITDVRFRPNSTQVATASFDKSVRLWDAANVMIFVLNLFNCFCVSIFSNRLNMMNAMLAVGVVSACIETLIHLTHRIQFEYASIYRK